MKNLEHIPMDDMEAWLDAIILERPLFLLETNQNFNRENSRIVEDRVEDVVLWQDVIVNLTPIFENISEHG